MELYQTYFESLARIRDIGPDEVEFFELKGDDPALDRTSIWMAWKVHRHAQWLVL